MRHVGMYSLVLALCGFVGEASANLVVNGDFEAPTIPGGTYEIFPPPPVPGWTLSSGPGIEIQNHIAGSPYTGNQFVELDSTANSSMYQDLATAAGERYTLSFAYSPRPGVAADSNGIDVFWDGSLIASLALSGVGNGDTVWQVYSFDVTATGAATRLEFAATGISDSLGGYIDAVAVNSVPEPSAIVLSGSALLASLIVARRRKPAA